MNPDSLSLPEIFLHPGEFRISTEAEKVTAVLGSCLSVIMYDTKDLLSLMSHCMMPVCKKDMPCGCDDIYKFVDCSIHNMVEYFDSLNIPRNRTAVKLFGGAAMTKIILAGNNMISIGSQNILTAKKLIKENGLRLVSQDTGGMFGRKITLLSHTGEVFVKRLRYKDKLKSKDE